MYPSEWKGSTDPDDKSGVATFKIKGVEYALRLDSFTRFQMVGEMLERAFGQGKRFAARAMRRAMDQAAIDHDL